MQQLILNLVTNASEALEHNPGHAWIRLGVERADRDYLANAVVGADLPEAEYVYLEVEDDGSGIPARDLGRLFEPFFTSKAHGRGLGLAAVMRIVKSHGGAIVLESVTGTGTKLRVLFPQAESGSPNRR